jgi:hypothetical protein
VQIAATEQGQRTAHGYRRIFDDLFEKGQHAVLTQTHFQDSPPTNGGRWGTSVVFTITAASGEQLEEIARQAHIVAGAGHWPTGISGSAHITVRAIELHREHIPADDPLIARCAAALERTFAHLPRPVTLRLDGLTLTPSGVMACAYPIDSAADDFSVQLRAELGSDAWFEDQYDRNIWYVSLLHFAGPLTHPRKLIQWVNARRDLAIGDIAIDAAHLVTFAYDGHRPIMVALASVAMDT